MNGVIKNLGPLPIPLATMAVVAYARLLVGNEQGGSEGQSFPWVSLVLYVGFIVMAVLADPVANLLLRLHPFGKFALSRDETRSANLVGLCLLGLVVGIFVGVATDSPLPAMAGLTSGVLVVPASAVFRCQRGWPRTTMSLLTGVVTLGGLLGLVVMVIGLISPFTLGVPLLLSVFFSYGLGRALASATVRN